MAIGKSELIELANQSAREVGRPAVSESCFESWIHRKLLVGAKAKGVARGVNPNWNYPDSAAERVKLIVALDSLGATRTTQLVVCLWLFGASFNCRRIKEALKSELRRITKRQGRGRPWFKDHHADFGRLSADGRAKRIGQLPKLDSDLAATPFAMEPETYLQIGLRAYWGTEDGLGIGNLIFGNSLKPHDKVSAALPTVGIMPFEISGALGPPDESAINGYEVFDQVSADDLEEARSFFTICVLGLVLIAILADVVKGLASLNVVEKAAASFLTPEWMVPSAALLAISAFNVRKSSGPDQR